MVYAHTKPFFIFYSSNACLDTFFGSTGTTQPAYPQDGTLIWMGGIFSLRSSFLWIVFRAHLTLSFLCDGTLQLYFLLLLFRIEPTLPK
uniref:Uncharacterized protein n=1 Tax=Picea glauca TaxID=3330 RepID=A0A101M3D2_PICGL|nr:hypothetical protein ABT39_MTgene3383 [Picea glauca]